MRSTIVIALYVPVLSVFGWACTPFLGPLGQDGGDAGGNGDRIADSSPDGLMGTDDAPGDGGADRPSGDSPGDSLVDMQRSDSPDSVADSDTIDGSGDSGVDSSASIDAPSDSIRSDAPSAGPPTDNLILWLRADRGVTLVDGLISRWLDQSGHGMDAFQDDPKGRPALLPDALAGKPVVRVGEFQGLTLTPGFSDLTKGLVVLAVTRPSEPIGVPTAVQLFIYFGLGSQTVADSNVATQVGLVEQPDAGLDPLLQYDLPGGDDNSVSVTLDRWQLIETDQGSGPPGTPTVCQTLVDGEPGGIAGCPVPAVVYRDNNLLGQSIGLTADIAEILVYGSSDDVLSTQAEKYLRERWGLK